jgi:dipeptidase E
MGHETDLAELFGKGSKVAVINNAKDGKTVEERKQKTTEVLAFLSDTGLKPKEIDLRDYFNDQKSLEKELRKYPAVWAAGGNTFVLRRAMEYSGCGRLLYDMVRKNEIMYGGDSAGAILATPSLRGSEYGDDHDLIPEGYQPEVIWEGLGFVPFHVVPHYKSDWWGAEADKMLEYLKSKKLDYRTLMDGESLIINGDKEEFLK